MRRRPRTPPCNASARKLVELLENRHRLDLFFPEVKDGPTIFGGHLRLDALAIRKSWSPVRLMAYEIKVSRSDWLGDRKWEAYLPLAHEFSIVAPEGVVLESELPDSVGLLQPSKTATMLRTIRKAAYRSIEVSSDLLLYLLMSRSKPMDRSMDGWSREERMALWRAKIDDRRDLAHMVSKKLRERIEAAERAGSKGEELAALEDWLARRGTRWGSLLERVLEALDQERASIESARDRLRSAADEVAKRLNGEALRHALPEKLA